MRSLKNTAILCSYRYDPLGRVAVCSLTESAELQRFYLIDRLATEIQGDSKRTLMRQDDLLLAQHQADAGSRNVTLLATDQQSSVLHGVDVRARDSIRYTPYGHHSADSGLTRLPGFNGEARDAVTGHYLLGNGYRAFNPVLMRFNSPDNLSPFAEGGLNAYAYCSGDPINLSDPTGHFGHGNWFFGGLQRLQARWSRSGLAVAITASTSRMTSGSGAFKNSVARVTESTKIKLQPAPSPSNFEVGSTVVMKKTGARVNAEMGSNASAPSSSRSFGSGGKHHGGPAGKKWTLSKKGANFELDSSSRQHGNAQAEFDRFQNYIHSTGAYPTTDAGFKIHKFGGARDQFDDGALFELSLSIDKRAVFTVDLNERVVHVRAVGVHWRKGGRNNR